MIPGKKYDPGTGTSRRPTPEKFEHLKKYVTPVGQDIKITSIEQLTNINQQLEETSNLFVSNLISRVIAQIIGKCGTGFVTIEGTTAGELKVKLTAADIASLIAVELAAGSNLIGKVLIEGTSRTILRAVINESTAALNEIVTAVSGKKICITNLVLIVGGETNITLCSNANTMSGAMDFGGTDEPRGMTQRLGQDPLETIAGEAFKILSSGAVQQSGFITYYTE